MNASEEIKSRLDIVDVIREYIPTLKPVGVNFVALSPFKREKTPSFVVSPEKQIWHCFSTDKGGDIFTFLMEMDGINFVEALRILAPKAGVVLKKENLAEQSQRNKLLNMVEEAVNFYHKNLMDSSKANSSRNYLKERGVTSEIASSWQLGYSTDDWNDLMDFLKQKGFRENEIFVAGLASKKEGKNTFYNRFRGRIMFPINDVNGNTVAFSARISPEKEEVEKMGKYINSPQTPIYDKSRIVFGLDKAKMAIKENDFVILVEGQMDVISVSSAGFKNVVASSGTAFTLDQLKLIKRYTNNIALAFDMDEAGQKAADRVVSAATEMEMNIKVITIPEGKDPDELIRKNPALWKNSVKEKKHIMEYYFEKVFANFDIENIDHQKKATEILLPIINKFKNKVEHDFWIKKLAQILGRNESSLREEIERSNLKQKAKTGPGMKEIETRDSEIKKKTREEVLSEILLALSIKFPEFFEYIARRVTIDHMFGQDNKLFYKNLIIYYNSSINDANQNTDNFGFNYDNFKSWISNQRLDDQDNQLKLLNKLAVLGDKDFFEMDSSEAKNEVIKVEMALKDIFLKERKKDVEKLIATSEREGKAEEMKRLMEELKSLIEESRNLS